MKINRWTKKILLLITVSILAACGTSASFVKFDPSVQAVKKIAVVTVEEPVGYMAMDWGQPAGPFGAGKMTRQSKEYAALVEKSGFKLSKALNDSLLRDLRASGFELYKASVTREKPGELAKADQFPKSGSIDAYLDVVINYAGYTTYNVFDRDFKPDIRIKVQLVSAKDGKVLYSEVFMYGYHNPFMSATDLDAPKESYFKKFDDLKAAIAKSNQRLEAGAKVVARTIISNIKS